MATTRPIEANRARAIWRRSLASSFRTALACTIVGVATLYGPTVINRQVAFPAFSYATVILIVTDATLGDTLRCCWLALYATVLGVCPASLSLWLIGPARLTIGTTAAVVAISAFVVALPENTHLIAKRISLGQIVLVYVVAFINGGQTDTIMHPVHVAESTALGVVACILALMFPYPSLAYWEVNEYCKVYIENASERLKLFIKAFSAEDKAPPKALISQAKSLNKTGNKLLQSIKSKQESMQWERIPLRFLKSYKQIPGETLQGIEIMLRGMENALVNCSQFPDGLLHSELKNDLISLEEQILNQIKSITLENTVLQHKLGQENDKKFLRTLHTIPSIRFKLLPSLFFIFCLKFLHTKSEAPDSPDVTPQKRETQTEKGLLLSKKWSKSPIIINKKRLMPALKCSLSMGFSVLFGLIYNKVSGFWSGLSVAISLASAREATFTVANVKTQGTVLGSVYGVIGCFVFERYVKIRFISLLPWFIFSSFLRQSRMYGKAGGVSAVIGALLILGRKNYGTPSEFAIARIVETFIGLSCSIMVDILLHPTRAATLAKLQLSRSLCLLQESICTINLDSSRGCSLEESLKMLKSHLNGLGQLIEEAEVEPNFWFLPFHSACYGKLKASLSKMVDLLHFGSHALRFIEQESQNIDGKFWKGTMVKLGSDLKMFKDTVCSVIKCLEEVILVKSIVKLEQEYEKRKSSLDLEMGKSGYVYVIRLGGSDDDEMKKSTNSFLHNLDEIGTEKDGEEVKNEVILSLSALAYCMYEVLKETTEIEKAIKEVVQWENPSTQIDLHDIVYKLRALKKTVTT